MENMMNERIGELAEQAHDYTNNLIASSGWANGDEIFEEKFAELLIKECCSIVMADKVISWADSILICDNIKEEFGVE